VPGGVAAGWSGTDTLRSGPGVGCGQGHALKKGHQSRVDSLKQNR
jgi:hypothetical protein